MQIQIEYTLQDSGLNSTSLNNSIEIFLLSIDRLEKSRKINLLVSIVFLIIGLIGHLLTIFVFIQKRFRKNSCDVYILCLAINDLLFLIIHFFEDTIRTFKDIFAVNKNDLKLLHSLNLIDNSMTSCLSMNYLRYVLRFISAYIIVAFTIQRLLSIHSPFSQRFKSTKSAWLTIGLLTCCSFIINIWVLFYFEIQSDETYNNNVKSCEVKNEKKEWIREYFHITLAYIFIIILIPIIVIFVSNSIIIINIFQSCPKRNGLKMHKSTFNLKKKKKKNNNHKTEITSSSSTNNDNNNKVKLRPYYLTIDQIINRVTNKANKSKKITKMLILISFSYAFLNLPYLVAWSFYYYGSIFHNDDVVENNYLYAALKIAEIFYLLNYSIYFYIYYLSGSLFRNQLKYSSKYNLY